MIKASEKDVQKWIMEDKANYEWLMESKKQLERGLLTRHELVEVSDDE